MSSVLFEIEEWWWSRSDVLSSACMGDCHQPHHVDVIVDAGEEKGQPRTSLLLFCSLTVEYPPRAPEGSTVD